MSILLTGGLGYIGSHTCVCLLDKGYDVIIIDDLSNSKIQVLDAIKEISKKDVKFYQFNLLDYQKTRKVFEENNISTVVHFAGFKAVGESVQKPLLYYENNIGSTINLLKAMQEFNVNNFVFSSSATVYGQAKTMPITEDFKTGETTNPYGRTKFFIEEILKDVCKSNPKFNVMDLRYFNPIGAHESGLLGEDPNGIPNNLMPYMVKVALGKLPQLNIFGNDYDTPDGTGVRDYIHIMDLAEGHICAIQKVESAPAGFEVDNLGSGCGYSVLNLVDTFNKVNPKKITYVITARRPGDIDICYASIEKAKRELNWSPKRTLAEMCISSYIFGEKNIKD